MSATCYDPAAKLVEKSELSGLDILHEDFAKYLDACDPLKEFRNEYYIPKNSDIPFSELHSLCVDSIALLIYTY